MLHPMNVATIYTAACSRLPWTAEQLRPYVVHSYQDTSKPDTWFFDTFLLLDFKVRRGSSDAIVETSDEVVPENVGTPSNVGKKSDWQNLINSYFSPINGNTDSVLKRLDDCIAAAKLELGEPSFKHRVFLAVPEPISCFIVNGERKYVFNSSSQYHYNWDDCGSETVIFHRTLQGTSLSNDTCTECDDALVWFVNECIDAWDAANFQNLELAGFHWIGEGNPWLYIAIETMKNLGEHIRGLNRGLSLSVSFYYGTYKPTGVWNSNGGSNPYRHQCRGTFDYVFGQPNYSIGGGSGVHTGLDLYDLVSQAQQYANGELDATIKTREGIVVEMNNDCIAAEYNGSLLPTPHCRASFYLHALAGKSEMNLLYYTANGLLANAYDAATNASHGNLVFGPQDYKLFDHLAEFVRNRRREEAYKRADVNQNGNVDIADAQIVMNVMSGSDTDPVHVSRADINRDGVVDIKDFNALNRVMLGDID